VFSRSLTAGSNETVVFKVLAQSFVAGLEGMRLLPINVSFREAVDVDLICCHIAGDEVNFAVVGSSIQPVWVLEEQPERASGFIQGEGRAPVLKFGGIDWDVLGGGGWLGWNVFGRVGGHGTREWCGRGRGEVVESEKGERERARSEEEAEETN
jgi:hypothetical protein